MAKRPRAPKQPLTPAILHEMYQAIGGKEANLINLRKFTLLLLSFVGFFRFDEVQNLRVGDVAFFLTHMTIFLERSKTDVYRDGRTVFISRLHTPCCAVRILKRLLRRSGVSADADSYIFRAFQRVHKGKAYRVRSENRPLSYSTGRTLELFARIGLDPKKFGLHSARSGGASCAANMGIPDRLFKRHGRWVSERAKDGYVRDDLS